jgi:hypothetical protein
MVAGVESGRQGIDIKVVSKCDRPREVEEAEGVEDITGKSTEYEEKYNWRGVGGKVEESRT